MQDKAQSALETTREIINDEEFKCNHRNKDTDFTRSRSLSFAIIVVMIIRNSVKPLQNVLNEIMTRLAFETVTASAFSQARYKLKHTAFIELNNRAVVEVMYRDEDYLTHWGFRVLAIDGSKIRLPNTEEIRKEFGTIAYTNGKDAEKHGEHPYGQASVLYDVLNRIPLDATLGRADAYEVDLAIDHLEYTKKGDLLVMDRNYPSYRMLGELIDRERHFVIRCSNASFGPAREMLKGEGPDSQVVALEPCVGQRAQIQELGLPEIIRVRFVRVVLSTGELEVLVTSLLDEARYPGEAFAKLYYLRWGIETFYGVLKTRLELENFTGLGAEAVRQDFYATVFISSLESILTRPAQTELDARETKQPQQVNRSVSFHAIKDNILELLSSHLDTPTLYEHLLKLFLTNPTSSRPERKPDRAKSSDKRLLSYQRFEKKHCF